VLASGGGAASRLATGYSPSALRAEGLPMKLVLPQSFLEAKDDNWSVPRAIACAAPNEEAETGDTPRRPCETNCPLIASRLL
jgi:hypothetical protein